MKGHLTPFARAAQVTLQTGILTAFMNTAPTSAMVQTVRNTNSTKLPPEKIVTKPNVRLSASKTDFKFSAAHMPPGSFLTQPAPDVAHLVKQVRSNPAIAIRYSRLFHLPLKMVATALAQLHLATLHEDHIMQVYFVRKETVTTTVTVRWRDPKTHRLIRRRRTRTQTIDKLLFKARRIKANTVIYSLPDGTPLLIRVCGNPTRTRVSPEFYSAVPVPNFDPGEKLEAQVRNGTRQDDANLHAATRSVEPSNLPVPVVTLQPAEDVLSVEAIRMMPPISPADIPQAAIEPVYHWVHSYAGLWGFGGAGAPALIALFDTGSTGSPIVILPGGPPPFVPPPATNPPIGTTPGTPTLPSGPTPIDIEPTTPPDGGTLPVGGTSPGSGSSGSGGTVTNPTPSVPEPTSFVLAAALLVVSVSLAERHRLQGKCLGLL